MTPPTVEEVAAYVSEKGYTFDPELFVAKNEAKGWMYGKTPIKSWKAACVTWQKNENAGEYPSREQIAEFNRKMFGLSMGAYRERFKLFFGTELREERP
jgi:hypothetical protein